VLARLRQDLLTLQVRPEAEVALASLDSTDPDAAQLDEDHQGLFPALTNGDPQVRLPSFKMGYAAATLLLERVRAEQPGAPQQRIFPVEVLSARQELVGVPEAAE
jgi:hypothetical protein